MRLTRLSAAVFFISLTVGSSFAIEWYSPANIAGQDTNWHNPLNWSTGVLPTAGEMTTWRYASSTGAYRPIVISGAEAVSGTSTCGIWYVGTASITVTNNATYSITGGLNLQTNPADASKSPANIEFKANGGSTVNISGETQVGRKLTVGTGFGVCTINLSGVGTTLNQGGMMWFGWGTDKTISTRMNITSGAVANFNTTGGLRFQPDTVNGIYPVVNLAGGFINIKGNRTTEVAGWISNNYLIAYEGEGTIQYSYNEVSGYTNISSVPAPVTGYQNHVMVSWGDQIIVCGPGTDAAMDSQQAITNMLKRIKGRGFTGIIWRADLGDYEPGSLIINEWGYVRGLLVEASHSISESFDVLQYAQAAAEAEGLEFWVWVTTVFSDGSPLSFPTANPGPFTYERKYNNEHPEVVTVDRSGNPYYGIREYIYPGARADKVNELTWFAQKGMKNILACMRSEASQFQLPPDKADRYGFNQPIVDEMLSLYGINILTAPEFDVDAAAYDPTHTDVQKWHALRGSYLTQLYRDLRASVSAVNPDTKIAVMIPGGDHTGAVIGNIRVEWRKWIEEGLVDEFISPQTLAATEDWDSPAKGYLSDNLRPWGNRNFNPFTQQWGNMYTAADLRSYADSVDKPQTRILQTSGDRNHRAPAPAGADGWRTWIDRDSTDLGWYQRWKQWKKDIVEFGHIKFFNTDFDDFPEYSSGRNKGWGEYRYVPDLRYCPGLWWDLGDGTTNAATAQSQIRRGSSGMAMRLKTGGNLYSRHLTAMSNSYWSVDNPIMSGTCSFDFWVYRPDTTSSIEVTLTQELNATTSLGLWLLNSGAKYKRYINGSYTWYGSSVQWPAGQWVKFSIQVNIENKTYSAYSGLNNENTICTNVPYSDELSYFNMLKFSPQGTSTSVCYLDDVSVNWTPQLHFSPKGKNVYLADNFESHQVDGSINNAQPAIGSPWQLSQSSQAGLYTIENDLSYADGWKCLAVPLVSGGNVLVANSSNPLLLQANNIITADLDIFIETGKTALFGISQSSGNETAMIKIDSAGKIYCLDGSSYADSGKTIQNGSWYHFQLALDCSTRTYKVVAQQSVAIPFVVGVFNWNPQTSVGDAAVFNIKTQGGYEGIYPYIYYDNVEVTCGLPDECGNEVHPYPDGDFNNDCKVDDADLSIFSQGWLQQGTLADMNDDGVVDLEDFQSLAAVWLNCTYQCN